MTNAERNHSLISGTRPISSFKILERDGRNGSVVCASLNSPNRTRHLSLIPFSPFELSRRSNGRILSALREENDDAETRGHVVATRNDVATNFETRSFALSPRRLVQAEVVVEKKKKEEEEEEETEKRKKRRVSRCAFVTGRMSDSSPTCFSALCHPLH